jgi:anti-sigma regulatory factor (Ser/Thr protein kinase)
MSIEAFAMLSSDLTSVRIARAFVAHAMEEWRADVDRAAVEVATSEIVTNAIRHAGSPVKVTVRLVDDIVRVDIADGSRVLPVVRHVSPDTTSGRGMNIVEAVTDDWGVEVDDTGGKAVWFTVGAHSDHRPPRP